MAPGWESGSSSTLKVGRRGKRRASRRARIKWRPATSPARTACFWPAAVSKNSTLSNAAPVYLEEETNKASFGNTATPIFRFVKETIALLEARNQDKLKLKMAGIRGL